MDVLHIVFLGVYIIDAHAMWYYFNQNYIILKFIFFLEISDENQRFLKSFILFCVFHDWKPKAFSYTLCYPAYQVEKLNVGCKNSKMHVGDKTCIVEVQVLLYIHTHIFIPN